NGNEITDYYGFANMVHDKKRNEFSFKMSFYDTDIVITDMFTETGDPEAREKSNVQILVNGTDYANPTPIEIRPTFLDNNRYHGYLGMLKMTSHATKQEEFI